MELTLRKTGFGVMIFRGIRKSLIGMDKKVAPLISPTFIYTTFLRTFYNKERSRINAYSERIEVCIERFESLSMETHGFVNLFIYILNYLIFPFTRYVKIIIFRTPKKITKSYRQDG